MTFIKLNTVVHVTQSRIKPGVLAKVLGHRARGHTGDPVYITSGRPRYKLQPEGVNQFQDFKSRPTY